MDPNRVMNDLFGLQWASASPETRKETRKKLLRQAAKRKTADAAKNQLQAIKAHSSKRVCSGERYGEVGLPPGVLQRVMACLAAIEPDGVRGPAMAAADLANAALVSWDFHTASKHGLAVLAQQAATLTLTRETCFCKAVSVKCSVETVDRLPHLPAAGGWSWEQWAALQDPLQYKVPQLQQAAKQLKIPVRGSKAVLVVSILQAFGLQEPSRVDPQLLRAVLLERCCLRPWMGCELLHMVWEALQGLGPDKVDCMWPGLGEWMFNCRQPRTTAAVRRAALRKYAGVCSRQQLLRLQSEVKQLLAERVPGIDRFGVC